MHLSYRVMYKNKINYLTDKHAGSDYNQKRSFRSTERFAIHIIMVRLNKNQLDEEQLLALYAQFDKRFSNLDTLETHILFNELLGQEERVMLAKRFVAIIMLLESKSLYQISETLKISSSTAQTLQTKLQNDEYNGLVKMFRKNKKEYFDILKAIDDILTLGGILPHYNGPRYYWQKGRFRD